MRDRWIKKFRENRGGNEDRIIEAIDLSRAYNKLSLATVGSVTLSKETLVRISKELTNRLRPVKT